MGSWGFEFYFGQKVTLERGGGGLPRGSPPRYPQLGHYVNLAPRQKGMGGISRDTPQT